ncbi:MAG: MBL fold metallo-hydrolase [Gemmatimonadetes bacterium]|nr:MBL fold metallo-hydrolase [Gemmatimonadota bacterium]NIR79299.1 MBL fold metallo-hydrolase [Gemmatimonadota bacterium]NIT87956.1 MBL fold metallo-hydrolase [Gemmatimonadota bacterium]NIU31807.1 MBL fold metallo-hydrolase [Gemmatimonadota bacterium]NIU36422.1 MBL fold metallo-hydrolase [Gemmatimonadota bacterium]
MRSGGLAVSVVLLALPVLSAGCQASPEERGDGPAGGPADATAVGETWETDAFTFHRISDDVWHAVGTGSMAVGANAAVLINERDVLLVDSHVSPAAARTLLDQLGTITGKPVRYVVNTHFHFDHLHGNQVYPPEVEVIGHEFTRERVVEGGSVSGRAYELFVEGLPERIRAVEAALDTAGTDEARRELEERVAYLRGFREQTDEVVPTPPTATLARRLTLFRGGREIRIIHPGRGHTGGDVVVHLPGEGILITGDLLTPGLPYMGDGFPLEWARSLESLRDLEYDVVLSGHGPAFRDRARIDHLQAYLRDLWDRASALHDRGVGAAEAALRIDMTDHAEHYPGITEAGVHPHAVQRIYELIEERGDGADGM